MSSTNDTHQHLFVQSQLKSILKKSPSPRFLDSSMNFENDQYSNIILSTPYENEKQYDIDEIASNNNNSNHMSVLNDSRSVKKDNSNLSPIELPLPMATSNENSCQYKIDTRLIGTNPPVKSSRSSSPSLHTSDDEHEHRQPQQRIRTKPKKKYYRPFVINGAVPLSASSSDNNDERKAKRTLIESKTALLHSNKSRQKDMQLDEFMRKYQQRGGIHIPIINECHIHEQDLINHNNGNNNHDFHFAKQQNPYVNKRLTMDDTISLLESVDHMTLSLKTFSPLQLLFDVARTNEFDRRTRIDRIRQYVEEQIGITAFLTIYKLLKSSQIPIDIQRKPFCYYANCIPHLCCLIMLESEQQKDRL
ncbi:unnamed protein product [Rotaria magnacalcarata]|uniref:Uncharacterized protein n=1 Tax=Rotaria magnacalcarata TaxID=392030 RepID=A0A816P6D2_9BILA|nr:unnamed protein product [Rotaria magnacalcarata]CAF2044532.1 unnamed protein product [Rotaria magnacalcarata]